MHRFVLALFLASAVVSGEAADTYRIDPVHSFALFRVGHLGVGYVWGRFVGEEGKMGTITLGSDDAKEHAVRVVLPVKSIDTQNAKRDEHLRSPDFFDVAKHPELIFASRSWSTRADGSYELAGTLSIHGQERPVTVIARKIGEGMDPWGGARVGFHTEFTVKRSDFGMTTMLENNGVGDEVTIYLSIEGVQEKPVAPDKQTAEEKLP